MAQKPVLRGEVGCACVAREVSFERGGMGERGCARRLLPPLRRGESIIKPLRAGTSLLRGGESRIKPLRAGTSLLRGESRIKPLRAGTSPT